MKKILLCIFSLLFSFTASAQNPKFEAFAKKFVTGYKDLHVPDLELSYVSGLQHIGSAKSVQKQVDFFKSIKTQLTVFDPKKLTSSQKTDYELIKYETGLNLERLVLEQQWVKNPPVKISADGIITIPNGKAWYTYLLKRWVSMDIEPYQIYQFGVGEMKRVQSQIEAVRKQTGLSEDDFYNHLNDPEFFTSDKDEVQRSFEHTKTVVYSNLHKLFSDTVVPQ